MEEKLEEKDICKPHFVLTWDFAHKLLSYNSKMLQAQARNPWGSSGDEKGVFA